MSELSKHLLGLQQGEELVIHFVPDQKAIKVTAKFTRPNAPEQGTTRILPVEELRTAADSKFAEALGSALAELRKFEPRVM